MIKILGITFFIYAVIYIITVLFMKYLLMKINDDCVKETSELVCINIENKKEFKHLKEMINELKGIQFLGNPNIPLRKIEDEINRFEEQILKKELSNDSPEDR